MSDSISPASPPPEWAGRQLDALRRADAARKMIDAAVLADATTARGWLRGAARMCEAAARDLEVSVRCGAPS